MKIESQRDVYKISENMDLDETRVLFSSLYAGKAGPRQ